MNRNSATPKARTPEPDAPQGNAVARRPQMELVRQAFQPVKQKEDDFRNKGDEGRKYLNRIIVSGFLSLVLFFVVYSFMENPLNLPVFETRLSWQGLMVYSSIVALVLFLCIILFRYFALLYMSYMYTAKYTAEVEEDPNFRPPVSIVIPAYNEGKLLRDTVMSLVNLDYPEYEVIIVDDGSTDNTREVARTLVGTYDHVSVKLVTKPNGGKATALNAGVQVAQYDYVLCVDGDSQLTKNTLRRAIRHFKDPRIGAVAGNVKVMNRNNALTNLQALEYVEGLNMVRAAQSSLKLVNIIPGPVGLFRKQAIIDGGWYASDTFAEDCDITLKIIREGWRVVYEPDAISWTEAPEKLTHLLKQRYRWTRGILQSIRKHKDLLFNATVNLGATMVMWLMMFESLVWPLMNVFANLYFLIIALTFDVAYYLLFWWLSLTILDFAAAMYCIAAEKEEVRLIPYVFLYRLFFVLVIDVCKTLATIEEFLGISMSWGKLERIGSGGTMYHASAPSQRMAA